jgi:NAD(P)-dependent dehydrogenase (short-subunit alcohol dehydrogenase family)
MRLQGKIAVITGAASGMGRAMAERFAVEGASIVAADWNAQRLDEVVQQVQSKGGAITGSQGNIADQATAEGLVALAVNTYGRIDILCNNAGVMDFFAGVAELTDDVWRRVLGINLDGPMFATRKAVQHMVKQGGGSIINTASMAGTSGASAGVAYTVSKHGLLGLTRSTAWMYGPQGVRCNAICPGATKTNIGESMDPARLDQAGLARASVFNNIVPGMLESEDIAALALFLASDESRHINGAIIPADAGWRAV